MKHFQILFYLLSLSLSSWAQDTIHVTERAQFIIGSFQERKFEKINPLLDHEMSRVLGETGLEELWDAILMQFGEISKIYESSAEKKDTLFVTRTKVDFEKRSWFLKLVFNRENKISGFFIEPLTMPYEAPIYANLDAFYEYKKTIHDPKFPVDGILTLPKSKNRVPVIIILGGSGPTDKDLTIGSKRIYKDIAWGLASAGIAVFRFDKRTLTHARSIAAVSNFSIDDEYLKDTRLAIKMLKDQAEIDPNQIYVLGHSLGGHILPYLATKLKGVSGYIGFAANYSSLPDLMAYQADFLSKDLPEQQKEPYRQLKQKAIYARDRFSVNSPMDSLPDGLTAIYLQSLYHAAPNHHLRSLGKHRFLFIQCEKDYQVPNTELKRWQDSVKDTQASKTSFISLPLLNHLGCEELGEMGTGSYEKPGNVSIKLLDEIAQFVIVKKSNLH